jgi:hypothetical protein
LKVLAAMTKARPDDTHLADLSRTHHKLSLIGQSAAAAPCSARWPQIR